MNEARQELAKLQTDLDRLTALVPNALVRGLVAGVVGRLLHLLLLIIEGVERGNRN